MEEKSIITLFRKYLNNQINSRELQNLLDYFEHSEASDDLTPLIKDELDRMDIPHDKVLTALIADRAEQRIIARTEPAYEPAEQPKHRSIRLWPRIAAAVLVVIAGSAYFYFNATNRPRSTTLQVADVAPGGNQATLTLPDGHVVDLSTSKSVVVIGNEITYSDGTGVSDANYYQTDDGEQMSLSTPKGGQYQVILPDGTKVWLNAASSLRYPKQFTGATREVELNGEGYFEVTKNEHQPFLVKSNGQVVRVLGTAFNINAYHDEARVTTTLVEGSVAIGNGAATQSPKRLVALKPGQQASYQGGRIQVSTVDVNDYVAWKNGQFVFYGESMPMVIRQIERWYDVSFEHQELAEGIELWGSLSRDAMLSQILKVIELNTPLTFEREGRRIILAKK